VTTGLRWGDRDADGVGPESVRVNFEWLAAYFRIGGCCPLTGAQRMK